MAMIKCRECGKEISDTATNCPNCGAETTTSINDGAAKSIGTILGVIALFGGWAISNSFIVGLIVMFIVEGIVLVAFSSLNKSQNKSLQTKSAKKSTRKTIK